MECTIFRLTFPQVVQVQGIGTAEDNHLWDAHGLLVVPVVWICTYLPYTT